MKELFIRLHTLDLKRLLNGKEISRTMEGTESDIDVNISLCPTLIEYLQDEFGCGTNEHTTH